MFNRQIISSTESLKSSPSESLKSSPSESLKSSPTVSIRKGSVGINDSLKSDCDKKDKDIRTIKKEMATIIKENQKLQSELKTKNETINSLINQNFTELKSLQDKHDKIVNSMSSSYDGNVKDMEDKYKLFRLSFQSKLKDNMNIYYKLNNERMTLLDDHNKHLLEKISELRKDINIKETNVNSLTAQNDTINKKYGEMETKYVELEYIKKILEQQLGEVNALFENQTNAKIENDKKITTLLSQKEDIEMELHSTKLELTKNLDTLKKLSIDTDQAKNAYQEIYNKHILLLNENVTKQNSLDEKTLENLSINSRLNEIEKKNILLDSNRKDLSIKITEFIHQVDGLQSELLSAQKLIIQLKNEKDVISDEKFHYAKEAEQYKSKTRDMELSILERIKQMQEFSNKEKEKYVFDQENKLRDAREKHEKQILALRNEYNTSTSDMEKQIDGLTSYLKSYTDNQYITLGEIEKLKITNEKLRMEHVGIDQKLNEIHMHYRKELDELKSSYKKEKEILIDSYNETIKKSQELNDALQNRLNQTIEALGLSKTAISNLKDSNQNLEKQMHSRESEDGSYQDKYNQIKSENLSLREKLERSIELNNSFNNKEKQYESQIKQLQAKYAQLINLTKKGLNSVSQQ